MPGENPAFFRCCKKHRFFNSTFYSIRFLYSLGENSVCFLNVFEK